MYIWIRASFPRYRYDQIMRLGWKIFIPITLAWLVVVAVLDADAAGTSGRRHPGSAPRRRPRCA